MTSTEAGGAKNRDHTKNGPLTLYFFARWM